MQQSELIAPITVDLRAEDQKFDVVKGIEYLKYQDGKLAAGVDVEQGDWVVRTATGYDAIPAGDSVPGVYPVVVGNNQYDSLATGNVTVALGGGFLYMTKKFVAGSYNVNDNLTVKDGTSVPQLAEDGDVIVARVDSYDATKGVMGILVLNR